MSYGEVAQKYKDKLPDIKKCIADSREYFQDNINRYNEFMSFVFKSSLTQDDENALDDIGKPTIEFNILESKISRLRGEFAKQQPSLTVRAADGVPIQHLTQDFIQLIDLIEAHLRAIFFDATNDKLEYDVYSDLLAGGWSVLQVYTDYVSEMSFEQNIFVERVFDPTLTGFDPLARQSHKGDGDYCFCLYPMKKEDFEKEFGEDYTKNMKFQSGVEGFSWSYRNGNNEAVILVCDYYC
mgnify:CR=1 FL=1